MPHVVLLGDSIFDNASYVPAGWSVIDRIRKKLSEDWEATLLAVDGAVTRSVKSQLTRLPADASHLVVSVGGNDALGESDVVDRAVSTIQDALGILSSIHSRFRCDYEMMLNGVLQE